MIAKYKLLIVASIVVFTIITCINPIYPEEQILQHIGTALLVLLMLIDIKKNYLGKISFIGLALFTTLSTPNIWSSLIHSTLFRGHLV